MCAFSDGNATWHGADDGQHDANASQHDDDGCAGHATDAPHRLPALLEREMLNTALRLY